MKTAVLISGQARTFKRCLPNQHWEVYRKLPEPHFFVSVADDADAESVDALHKLYPGRVFIEKIKQPELTEVPAYHCNHAPYAVTPTAAPGVSAVQGFLRLYWHLSRVWDFFGENATRAEFDLVMWSRGDLWFHHFELPKNLPSRTEAYFTWWGLYGGYNTSGGIMGLGAAESYCRTYEKIPAMLADGCPLHCESLNEESLARDGMTVRNRCVRNTLEADFGFMRADGLKHMVVTHQEICRYTAAITRPVLAEIQNNPFQPPISGKRYE